jgi:predicted RNase H-like HicB family nuclease
MSFPDLIGVTTVAGTLDEALTEASVAPAFALEDWPGDASRPRSLDALRADPAFVDWSADAVVAAVSPTSSINEAA